MARKTIFIASSQEAVGIAERVAKTLAENKFVPVPWWDSFRLGSYTMDQLNQHAASVDGAIFLATKGDKVWSRKSLDDVPRDNVILEFGMFAARLGLSRSIILTDYDMKLPSDLKGITYPMLGPDVEAVTRKVVEHFNRLDDEARGNNVASPLKVICDPQIAAHQVSKALPNSWLMRAMYLGTDGARAWYRIVDDPKYQGDLERQTLLEMILRLLRPDAGFRTYVSLGPGDALIDKAIATRLLSREPTTQCIPVDLSDGLLWEAMRILSSEIRIPAGILADFEDSLRFVAQTVRTLGKPPYLYGLFGNTFGNLDRNETSFMEAFHGILNAGDELLLDVSVLKSKHKRAVLDPSRWGDGMKAFFAHGAARKLGEPVEGVLKRFNRIITVKAQAGSAIKGTTVLTVCASDVPFARIRRYDLAELENSFRAKGFTVRSSRIETEGAFDLGVIALQKSDGSAGLLTGLGDGERPS